MTIISKVKQCSHEKTEKAKRQIVKQEAFKKVIV